MPFYASYGSKILGGLGGFRVGGRLGAAGEVELVGLVRLVGFFCKKNLETESSSLQEAQRSL